MEEMGSVRSALEALYSSRALSCFVELLDSSGRLEFAELAHGGQVWSGLLPELK